MDATSASRGWIAALAMAAAAALAIAIGGPADAPAAATPDCNKNPDACKVATTGKSVTSPRAHAARVGRSRCQDYTFERWGKSAAGIKLWSWYLDVHWCYRRGRLTAVSADPRPDTHVPLWSFDKQLAFRRSGGKRKSFYRVYSQGRFELCITKLGCIQDAQPWIRVVARANGTYSFQHGG